MVKKEPLPDILWWRRTPQYNALKSKYINWCRFNKREPFPCKKEQLNSFLDYLRRSGKDDKTIENAKFVIEMKHKMLRISLPSEENG